MSKPPAKDAAPGPCPTETQGRDEGAALSEYSLAAYRFHLPPDLIAQEPLPGRDASRLMVLSIAGGQTVTGLFTDLPLHLPEDCLLVANNSRVIPARLSGRRATGGKVEFLLLTPPPLLRPAGQATQAQGWACASAEGLLRSSKPVRQDEEIRLADDLFLLLRSRGPFGRCLVDLHWKEDLARILERDGSVPLPPYIRRQPGEDDKERYQTIYARADKPGSVAAPTAGLHFTPAMREALAKSGRQWTEVTLHVGYGTFSPVRCDDIRQHAMHEEYVEVPEETAKAVTQAKRDGRPVIAVGTTSARALEGAFAAQRAGKEGGEFLLSPHMGPVNVFFYPGRAFRVVDGMVTNFHLPESSLLMLVSALAGRESVLNAYATAVAEGFRFFSYGDAMLIK